MTDKGNQQDRESRPPLGFKERLYEKLRMPLWLLDIIIVLLFLALAVSLFLGLR